MKKTATLLGATGLIGSEILKQLLKDVYFDEIKIIVRNPYKCDHPKVNVEVIDFENQVQFENAMHGSTSIFCAIGTTQKKVKGDKKAYRRVDFDIPVNAAKWAKKSGANQFIVVSSVGADQSKNNFYLKLKGEVENALQDTFLKDVKDNQLSIFRPSLLLGKRSETRIAEDIGQFFSKVFKFLIPGKTKPIEAETVAKAMIASAKTNQPGVRVYHYRDMIQLIQEEK
ncbi:segregation protein B [Brumimicrobium salinarum]|uniref:Segregation protein B n=1 Tax=Brumimicrobium salinarum TaxID=2058658 RepID=A0A2I0R0V1_9FLAO|nr:NAD(P)H-binding protein [Brumimicrobium salinarum]PKR80204.1 segregation protein B [Brumimicrobium salinarum]